jgi:HK97 family phage portal protein
MESYTGAWQQNVVLAPTQTLLSVSAIYGCVTGIAGDIAKLRIKLTKNSQGIWDEVEESPFLGVLRKPNDYQTMIQFVEQWEVSKLLYGNTYVLKEREERRGLVKSLYVLHPRCVNVLVASDGGVYYEINRDDLSGVTERVTVPASEIIHDKNTPLWHPLVGVSPLYACALSGTMSGKIQENSTNHFTNKSMPGGVLSAPGVIDDVTAARLKANFEENYSGTNIGRVAVLGDGLAFSAMRETAEASQLIEQLQWTVLDVARAFKYPSRKLQVAMPYASNPEAVQVEYLSDCLQYHLEQFEACMNEGLGLPYNMGVEFDLDGLLRMDTLGRIEASTKAIIGGLSKPNEGRFKENLPPVEGGDQVYLQQQNFSLAALAKRDAKEDPFATEKKPEPTPTPIPPTAPEKKDTDFDFDEFLSEFDSEFEKELCLP